MSIDDTRYGFSSNIAVLLLFLIAFYGLLAEWRKMPFLVNSIYRFIFAGLGFVLTETIIGMVLLFINLNNRQSIENSVDRFLTILFLSYVGYHSLRDYNRYFRFRSDVLFKKFKFLKSYTKKEIFPHLDPDASLPEKNEADPTFLQEIMYEYFLFPKESDWSFIQEALENSYSISVVCQVEDRTRLHSDVSSIAYEFLKAGGFIQYVSCTRHPIEFLNRLKSHFKKQLDQDETRNQEGRAEKRVDKKTWNNYFSEKWKEEGLNNRIILIDAHSHHFGFSEPVYDFMTNEAKHDCLDVLTSSSSYPGVHSSLIAGFKKLSKDNRAARNRFALILFEEVSALTDLESVEQYRVFMRHVIPSERLMGRLFIVFYESRVTNENVAFLRAAADKFVRIEEDVAYTSQEITQQLEKMAAEVQGWAKQLKEELLIVPVLHGGRVLYNDLAQKLKQKRVEYKSGEIYAFSYDVSGNKIHEKLDIAYQGEPIEGKVVLFVDDICHTGHTLNEVCNYAERMGAANVFTAVAIQRAPDSKFKPSWYLFRYQDRYSRFPDAWMYGYGMDNGGDNATRELRCFLFARRH